MCIRDRFRPMRNTISGNEGRGTMKIVVDANTDKVVGIHIVGPESGEIMQVRMLLPQQFHCT